MRHKTILHEMTHKGYIDPPSFVLDNLCYLVRGGSHAYGTATENSDNDLIGYCIPPSKYIFPTSFGFVYGYDDLPRFDQFIAHGIEYNGQDYDITIYNITKFAKLAIKGNPNVIEILYFDRDCVLFENEVGKKFRNNKHKFLSQECYNRFMGFAQSHLHKIRFRKKSGNRQELIDTFGYDVKDASHLMRAYDQAFGIITGHYIQPRVNCEFWKKVKEGVYCLEEILQFSEEWEEELKSRKAKTTLAYKPDYDAIRELLMEVI